MLTNPSFPGETYQLSDSIFPRADESSVAYTGGSNLTVNLRRDVTECEICPSKVSQKVMFRFSSYLFEQKAGGCNCRGKSFSTDNGLTWTEMELGK